MIRAPWVTLVALFALSLTLVACGGDGNSEDEDQITAAIETDLTSVNPSKCTEVQTQKFTEQINGEGETGVAAVKRCEQDAPDAPADSVEVSDIEVDGDNATAKAEITGSLFNGQTGSVALVKQGEQWKVDELKGFEDFDRNALLAGLRELLSTEQGVPGPAVDCVIKQVSKLSDEQIETLYTTSDPRLEGQIFGVCGKFFKGE